MQLAKEEERAERQEIMIDAITLARSAFSISIILGLLNWRTTCTLGP